MNEQTKNEIRVLIAKINAMHEQKIQQKDDKKLIDELVKAINQYYEINPNYIKITLIGIGVVLGITLGSFL